MLFWDTSALLQLIIKQPQSVTLKKLFEGDRGMAVWWGTRIELVSALCRIRREGTLTANTMSDAKEVMEKLLAASAIIQPMEVVSMRAERLLATHTLRAADALQVAAAIVATSDRTADLPFVTLDVRMREAAGKEGFRVLPKL